MPCCEIDYYPMWLDWVIFLWITRPLSMVFVILCKMWLKINCLALAHHVQRHLLKDDATSYFPNIRQIEASSLWWEPNADRSMPHLSCLLQVLLLMLYLLSNLWSLFGDKEFLFKGGLEMKGPCGGMIFPPIGLCSIEFAEKRTMMSRIKPQQCSGNVESMRCSSCVYRRILCMFKFPLFFDSNLPLTRF